jgi:uncharacterized protein YecE (DUF72 family)
MMIRSARDAAGKKPSRQTEQPVKREAEEQGDLFGGRPDGGGSDGESDSVRPPLGRHGHRLGREGRIHPLGREGRIRVGTSGYSFADWVGPFYPADTPRGAMLDEYVQHFDVVEINSSYYRIPNASMFERMEQKTPDGFEFIVKLFRGMTHEIEDNESMYRELSDAVEPLRDAGKFSGYLAQFPWKFKNGKEARAHLAHLRKKLGADPLFVEFRHDSWIEDKTFEYLRGLGIGYCSVDEPRLKGLVPPLVAATTDEGYVRFHGRNARNWWGKGGGDRYDYDYNGEELAEWAEKMLDLESKVKKVYAFFNNCHAGHAARNAELMIEMLSEDLL